MTSVGVLYLPNSAAYVCGDISRYTAGLLHGVPPVSCSGNQRSSVAYMLVWLYTPAWDTSATNRPFAFEAIQSIMKPPYEAPAAATRSRFVNAYLLSTKSSPSMRSSNG